MTLYRERKHPEALAAFQSAAQVAPDDCQSADEVDFLLFKTVRGADSVPRLEKTAALDPARAPACVHLGDAYDKSGRTAEAANSYRKYLEMPDSPLKERGRARIGKPEAASNYLPSAEAPSPSPERGPRMPTAAAARPTS